MSILGSKVLWYRLEGLKGHSLQTTVFLKGPLFRFHVLGEGPAAMLLASLWSRGVASGHGVDGSPLFRGPLRSSSLHWGGLFGDHWSLHEA